MPCQVDLSGASGVGNPAWVPPEEYDRRLFLKFTAVAAQPSERWKLPAQLAASAPAPILRAGQAPLSAVAAGAHRSRHSTEGPGARGNPGYFWHL